VLILAGPQIRHPDEVRVACGLADEVQDAGRIVVEQPAGLKQQFHHPVSFAWFGVPADQ
jgi:hypothetical protein